LEYGYTERANRTSIQKMKSTKISTNFFEFCSNFYDSDITKMIQMTNVYDKNDSTTRNTSSSSTDLANYLRSHESNQDVSISNMSNNFESTSITTTGADRESMEFENTQELHIHRLTRHDLCDDLLSKMSVMVSVNTYT
jgi:hypothetical protein